MVNYEIKSKVVDLVNSDGKGLQRMKLEDAITLAEKTGDDIICVNQKGDIPVVKIGNYKKFLYEKEKKARESKKKYRQNFQDLKEIQMSDVIAEHDMKIKAKNASRILKEGDKVKLVIKYKGRGIRLIAQGPAKLHTLLRFIDVNYTIDKEAKIEGNRVIMIISPIRKGVNKNDKKE